MNRNTEDIVSKEEVGALVEVVKERGLAGLSLNPINSENNKFRGDFARMVAEILYL